MVFVKHFLYIYSHNEHQDLKGNGVPLMEEGKIGYVFIFDYLIDTYLCDIEILWITIM